MSSSAADIQAISPKQSPSQAVIFPFPRRAPPRPRRKIEVRVVAIAGLYPYGGVTRSFELSDRDLDALIALAERLEARRA